MQGVVVGAGGRAGTGEHGCLLENRKADVGRKSKKARGAMSNKTACPVGRAVWQGRDGRVSVAVLGENSAVTGPRAYPELS